MNAALNVNDYFESVLLILGWLVNNSIWDMLMKTGMAAVPFIALVVSEWFQARQEGDDEGNKGLLTINRIETKLYAMVLVYIFTCLPVMSLSVNPVNLQQERASECGVVTMGRGEWGESTLNVMDGQTANIPLWWAFVHAVSKGVTNAAVAAIPCSTDYQAIKSEMNLQSIEDQGLQRQLGEFQRACFGAARNMWYQDGNTADSATASDIDWIGSETFLNTPGYYDSFYAPRPIDGFPYDADRDMSRSGTGPGQPGYPTCEQWWNDGSVGLRARILDELDPGFLTRFKSIFTSETAEDAMIRGLISPRSGAGMGNMGNASTGYLEIGGEINSAQDLSDAIASQVTGTVYTVGAVAGGALAWVPFQSGMVMIKQALPMVQAIMVMAVAISLPFIMVMSAYSMKAAGVATFGLFALWFLTFWWELARWMDSNLTELVYNSSAGSPTDLEGFVNRLLGAADNAFDVMVLQFVQGMMFLVLPAVFMGLLAWSGSKVGGGLSQGISQTTQKSQQMGEKGGQALQDKAAGGK